VFPEGEHASDFRVHLCFGPNCTPRGSRSLLPILQRAIFEAGLSDRVEVIASSCRARCEYGPSLNVYPGPVFYMDVTEEAIREIVQEHLVNGRPARQWLFEQDARGPARQR
jgi:NADH-quinone oxidoreductase subunit F